MSLPISRASPSASSAWVPGALADDEPAARPLLGQQLHQRLRLGAELGLGKGPVPLFAALAEYSMREKWTWNRRGPLHPPSAVSEPCRGWRHNRLWTAMPPSVRAFRWPKSMQGVTRLSTLAQGQHLFQRAQLADLPHGFRAAGSSPHNLPHPVPPGPGAWYPAPFPGPLPGSACRSCPGGR